VAEPRKDKKVSLRQILDEIAEDESFSDEDRQLARDKIIQLDSEEWNHKKMVKLPKRKQ